MKYMVEWHDSHENRTRLEFKDMQSAELFALGIIDVRKNARVLTVPEHKDLYV